MQNHLLQRQSSRARRQAARRRRGFTIVEIIVVVMVIAVLATLVGGRYFGLIGKSKVAVAQQNCKLVEQAVEKFSYEHGRFPANLTELVEKPSDVADNDWDPMLKPKQLLDPWGHQFVYQYPGQHDKFDLYSLGPEGREGAGGEDSGIHNW